MKVFRSLFLLVGLSTLAACAVQPDQGAAPVTVAPAQAVAAPQAQATVKKATTQHSFTVYFDTNKADIRAAAMQILYGAAQVAKAAKPVTIRVQGFTDASGKASHNQKLSERRAAAVADQLRKLGLDVAIETRGLGEAKGKGKSKEDRRVEVTFEGAVPETAGSTIADQAIGMNGFAPVMASVLPHFPTASTVAVASPHGVTGIVEPAPEGRVAAMLDCSGHYWQSCLPPPPPGSV